MKRFEMTHNKECNKQAIVPEIEGKGKDAKDPVKQIIAGTKAPQQKGISQYTT